MARIVVMGAGLGGMAAAYELREALGKAHPVSVVGLGDRFSFTPSNPWLAVGWRTPEQITLDAGKHLGDKGIAFYGSGAERIDADARQVHTGNGEVLDYDYLLICTGPKLAFDEVPARVPRAVTPSRCAPRRTRSRPGVPTRSS